MLFQRLKEWRERRNTPDRVEFREDLIDFAFSTLSLARQANHISKDDLKHWWEDAQEVYESAQKAFFHEPK